MSLTDISPISTDQQSGTKDQPSQEKRLPHFGRSYSCLYRYSVDICIKINDHFILHAPFSDQLNQIDFDS